MHIYRTRKGVKMEPTSSSDDRRVIEEPKGTDPQWQDKINRAKEARQMGQSIRQGKPKSFRQAVG